MLTIVGDIVMRPDQQRVLAILLLIIAVALLITSLWKLPASHFPLIMLSERMLGAATRFLEEAFFKLTAKARSSTRTR